LKHFFKVRDGFLYAATSSLKRVTGRISKWIPRSKQKLYIFFSPQKAAKKREIISDHVESTDYIFKTLNKYSFRDTVPLKRGPISPPPQASISSYTHWAR
jgi:hypothetical protein